MSIFKRKVRFTIYDRWFRDGGTTVSKVVFRIAKDMKLLKTLRTTTVRNLRLGLEGERIEAITVVIKMSKKEYNEFRKRINHSPVGRSVIFEN